MKEKEKREEELQNKERREKEKDRERVSQKVHNIRTFVVARGSFRIFT